MNPRNTLFLSGVALTVLLSTNRSWGTPAAVNLLEKRVSATAVTDEQGHIYVLGGDLEGAKPTIERLDPKTGAWTALAAPAKRFGAGAAVIGGKIFWVGGELNSLNSYQYATAILSYDPASAVWSDVGTLAGRRRGLAVAAVGTDLYAVGGTGAVYSSPAPAVVPKPGQYFLDAHGVRFTDVFSTVGNRYQILPANPRRRTQHGLVSGKDGRLFAIGGYFQGDFYGYPDFGVSVGVGYVNETIEAFDPATQTWSLAGKLPSPRYSLTAVTGKDGLVYVLGGRGIRGVVNGTVEIWDSAKGTWKTGKPMPTPVYDHASAVAADGSIYVVGGRDKQGRARGLVQIYDTVSDTWTQSTESTNPEDELDYPSLGKTFLSSATALPEKTELNGWWVGRCYEKGSEVVPFGGLLVAYGTDTARKVSILKTETSENRGWFDAMDAGKTKTIQTIVDEGDAFLSPVREVDGSLASLYQRHGEFKTYVSEYQVKKWGTKFISRAVSLNNGVEVKVICVHSRKL